MRERGILFNGAMVRALLAGTKTQTRRIVRPQPVSGQGMVNAAYCGHPNLWLRDGHCDITDPAKEWRCPFGRVGDRLWVRETFAEDYDYCDHSEMPGAGREHFHYGWHYRADGEPNRDDMGGVLSAWKPSIHMPRAASRITLEVTGVRVERLQDISEIDAVAEGIRISSEARRSDTCYGIYECRMPDGKTHFNDSAYDLYRKLWEQINGAGSWDANPWVWCVEFRALGTTTTSKEP